MAYGRRLRPVVRTTKPKAGSVVRPRLQTARRAVVRHALAAERAGFGAHEQALTEVLLTRVAPAAKVVTFTQREEASVGADWMWWWRGGGEWFGAIVQAKRHKPRPDGLPWYDFGYRTSPGSSRQIDRLLASARHHAVPAVYVLYNHPPIGARVPVSAPCCDDSESWRIRLRVAAVPALVARDLIGGREDIAVQHARPVECLTCSGRTPRLLAPVRAGITDPNLKAFLRGGDLSLARAAARGLVAQLAEARLGQLSLADDERWFEDAGAAEVFPDVPADQGHFSEPYIRHVLRGLRPEPPWYLAAALEGAPFEEVAAGLEGIAGLVIVDESI